MDDRDKRSRSVVYHSHTATEAYPSRTDISYANEPGAHYVLVSTADTDGAGDFQFPLVPYRRGRGHGGRGPGRRGLLSGPEQHGLTPPAHNRPRCGITFQYPDRESIR
ncbi:hypothetical protein SPURM210S_01411 [Streptomyces purpurascens]